MKEHEDNRLSRRQFLLASALAGGGLMLPNSAVAQNSMPMASTTATPPIKSGPADVTLRIGPVLVDVTKDKTISTIGYNGQVPGPLIRLREGQQVSVQLFNDTDTPEFVHWHGQFIPSNRRGLLDWRSAALANFSRRRRRTHRARAGHPLAPDLTFAGKLSRRGVVSHPPEYERTWPTG
jgi:Multicopper oxidase